jgi:hypothetical protein
MNETTFIRMSSCACSGGGRVRRGACVSGCCAARTARISPFMNMQPQNVSKCDEESRKRGRWPTRDACTSSSPSRCKAARAASASRSRVCDLTSRVRVGDAIECSQLHVLIGVARRRPRASSSTGGTCTTDIAAKSFLNEGRSRLGCPRERRSSHAADCCYCHSLTSHAGFRKRV